MEKMAVIIPYRNREEHLRKFLIAFPQAVSPQIPYEIFVIEQDDDKPFNRGEIKNIGFALTQDRFDYFCFHDVDMLPIEVDYSYPPIPIHLAANVSQFGKWVGKGLAYQYFFGGVVLFNKKDFIQVNGYSNAYWGYGCEDDDLLFRVCCADLQWTRRNGLFKSLPHPPATNTPEHEINKQHLLNVIAEKKPDPTGLSDLKYTLSGTLKFSTHTLYSVKLKKD